MTDDSTKRLFIVNLNFEGGSVDEIIRAEPSMVQDWLDAGFVSPVDEDGRRISSLGGVPTAAPGDESGAALKSGRTAARDSVPEGDADPAA